MPKTKPSLESCLCDPIEFYNGTVKLRFAKDPYHEYYLVRDDGSLEPEPLDGVTDTCHIIDKSPALIPWGCKMMAEKILRTMPQSNDDMGSYCESLAWSQFEALILDAKSAHKEKLEDAGNVGSAAHLWIEDSIHAAIAKTKGKVLYMAEQEPADERARNGGLAAFDWMKKHNVRFLKTEHKVLSLQYRYAGTMDGLALVDACDSPKCCGRYSLFVNELSIVDWKTSNYLNTEFLYQTAGYQHAEQEEFGKPIAARWILRLSKEDAKFEPWYTKDFDDDFEAFRLCLTLSRQHHKIERRIADNKKELTQIKKRLKKETE